MSEESDDAIKRIRLASAYESVTLNGATLGMVLSAYGALAAELAEAKRVLIDRAVQQGNAEAERDALRAALKKYGEHSFSCASEYDQCSCGLSEALRGTERPVVAVREVRDESK